MKVFFFFLFCFFFFLGIKCQGLQSFNEEFINISIKLLLKINSIFIFKLMLDKMTYNMGKWICVKTHEARTLQKRPCVGVGHFSNTDTPQTRLHACPWGVRQIKNIFLIPILRGHSNNTVATQLNQKKKKIKSLICFLKTNFFRFLTLRRTISHQSTLSRSDQRPKSPFAPPRQSSRSDHQPTRDLNLICRSYAHCQLLLPLCVPFGLLLSIYFFASREFYSL